MEEKFKLLYSILKDLQTAGVLRHCMLIGSWCQYFYRHHYENAHQIPATRTLDADILLPRRLKLDQPVDVNQMLMQRGFIAAPDVLGRVVKYLHRDLSVDFLVNAGAQTDEKELRIRDLNIVAQELHFLGLLHNQPLIVNYRDLQLTVPEPEAFALHKLIVSRLRKDPEKMAKDIETVQGMFRFFKDNADHITRLHVIFESLPAGWKKKIRQALSYASLQLPSA